MQKVLHLKTTVLPGGKIEIVDKELPVGKSVNVVVTHSSTSSQQSAVDILAEAPGQRLFKSPEDVEAYLKGERETAAMIFDEVVQLDDSYRELFDFLDGAGFDRR